MHEIRLMRNLNLFDIERMIADLPSAKGADISVLLPRQLGAHLFKESRVTALLATAATCGRVVLRDWGGQREWSAGQGSAALNRRLEGLAGLLYAAQVGPDSGPVASPPSAVDLGESLLDRRGLLEDLSSEAQLPAPSPVSWRTLTVCAIDDVAPEPIVLGGVHSKEKFVAEFSYLRDQYLDRALGVSGPAVIDPAAAAYLAGFVYELYENSYEHGRLNERGAIIPGLRYVRLKKHLHYNFADFLRRAAGFAELEEYLRVLARQVQAPLFYEIAVSDHGLGLVRRFIATRPDIHFPETAAEAQVALTNRIINEALSSKVNQPGAGYGLQRALAAVRRLRGFVSLRTDSVWLWYTSGDVASTAFDFQLVEGIRVGSTVGTHFNMLFPIER